MVTLTDADRQKIAEAVARAESRTSGEICCVLTEEVSHYREIPLAWGATAALLVPPLFLAAGFRPRALAETLSGWAAGQGNLVERDVLLALAAYALVQVVLFAAVAAIATLPAVRRAVTPRFVKRHRMQLSARKYFSGLAARAGGTAVVMIYASRLDRMVEIVVSDVAAAACDAEAWRSAANAIGSAIRTGVAADGLVRAIALCGDELARHFPPTEGRPNLLPDSLLEG